MHNKTLYTLFFIVIASFGVNAQVVTINPTFATQTSQVTVTFNAAEGNKALMGQNVVYAHTGVITNLSPTPSSWRYVQGNWGTDDNKVKMTKVGTDLFTLTFTINTFYGVPANEQVRRLAFVFRNQSGNLVGRETDGSDIFVDLSTGAFTVRIETANAQVLPLSQAYNFKGITSQKASLKLFQNGQQVAAASNDSVLNFTVAANTSVVGKYTYIFEAFLNGNFYRDTTYMVYRGSPFIASAPLGTRDGVNILNDTSVILQLHAPFKEFIFANGDWSNWEIDTKYFMNKTPDGQKFWIQLNGLNPTTQYRYQYYIDNEQLRIADPYSELFLDPFNDPFIPSVTYPNVLPYPTGKTTEYVSVFKIQQDAFNWQHSANFQKPAVEKLVIYELLVRDFIARHDYETLIDTLDYLQNMGVNAIELMPVNEFEGNESWGYNTVFYFALDKYYGTKNAFKAFVDECHRRGIAVITDVVLNHSFGQSSMVRMYFDKTTGRPLANNPWFNVSDKHPFGVGYDFNHESQVTKNLVDSVLRFWVEEYKIDGFRFDLSKGFTQKNSGTDVGLWGQYDAGRIATWKRIYNKVRTYDSTCYMILEHFADNSEEKELAAYGFMLWGNVNHAFAEATMGFVSTSNLSALDYKSRTWNKPHLVGYAESHDEERLMYKNITFGNSSGSYSTRDLNTGLKRIEAAMCFLIPLQGPKMIWQFGEVGYDYSIDFNGRVGNKPIRWDYLQNARRKRIYEVTATLAWLKQNEPSYSTANYTYSTAGGVKLYKVNDSTLNTVCVGNFNLRTDSILPLFQHAGMWYDLFTGDSLLVSGANQRVVLAAGQYRFYTDRKINSPVVISGLSELEKLETKALVYPNPSNDRFVVELPIFGTEMVEVSLHDLSGRLVYSTSVLAVEGVFEIHNSDMNLPAGTFILSTLQKNNNTQTKIIIL
jgi:hypothetical protein